MQMANRIHKLTTKISLKNSPDEEMPSQTNSISYLSQLTSTGKRNAPLHALIDPEKVPQKLKGLQKEFSAHS